MFDFKNETVDIFANMTIDEAQNECAIICSNYMTQIFEQLKRYKISREEYSVIVNSLMEISSYSFKSGYMTSQHDVQMAVREFIDILKEEPIEKN